MSGNTLHITLKNNGTTIEGRLIFSPTEERPMNYLLEITCPSCTLVRLDDKYLTSVINQFLGPVELSKTKGQPSSAQQITYEFALNQSKGRPSIEGKSLIMTKIMTKHLS